VDIELVPDAGVDGGNDVGLGVDREPDVAEEPLVEDGIDRRPLVRGSSG